MGALELRIDLDRQGRTPLFVLALRFGPYYRNVDEPLWKEFEEL